MAVPPHIITLSLGFDNDFAAFISVPPMIILTSPAATAMTMRLFPLFALWDI
ncbi:hypothetical protein F5148DRAFT_1288921 [Russula earlei]|uniref:Uncharacterized protein n=1 Tax=Russula earlei TaxID=71964 RepID=A0ACC0TZH3_9AGAM|nr:hypothetical protein F5148DRAFT_1288921 [Russula earlei]